MSKEKKIYILTYVYANGTPNREYFTTRAGAAKQLRKYQRNHKGGHGQVVEGRGTGIHPPFDTIRKANPEPAAAVIINSPSQKAAAMKQARIISNKIKAPVAVVLNRAKPQKWDGASARKRVGGTYGS